MGMYIKSEGEGLGDIKKALQYLKHHKLYIGIPEKETSRQGGDITNVALAFIHTYGSPKRGIPPRPFLEPGLVTTGALEQISTLMGEAVRAALKGQQSAADSCMTKAGLVGERAVRDYISAGLSPGLAESTRKAKARKGSTADLPLIDTGSLLKSITYVIEEA